jgi:tetratricopeptide (TPR) repeat protein
MVERWQNARAADAEQAGLWAAAEGRLDALIVAHPDDWTLRARRGRAYAERGEWDKARTDYAEARRLAPGPAVEWLEREAAACDQVGERWPEFMALDQLVVARTSDPAPCAARARILASAGRWKEAAADLAAAVKRGDHTLATACDLAAVRLMAGEPDRSPADRVQTGDDAQRVARLLVLRPGPDRDALDLAHRLANRAIAAAPDDATALATLALVELRDGKPAAALDVIGRMDRLPRRPGVDPPFAAPLRALVLAASGKTRDARGIDLPPSRDGLFPDPAAGAGSLADQILARQLTEEARGAVPNPP